MTTLIRITKINGTYQALYRETEVVTNTYALPVFTNVPNMTGKINSSRTLRHLHTAPKVRQVNTLVKLNEEAGELLFAAARKAGMVDRYENFGGVRTAWMRQDAQNDQWLKEYEQEVNETMAYFLAGTR